MQRPCCFHILGESRLSSLATLSLSLSVCLCLFLCLYLSLSMSMSISHVHYPHPHAHIYICMPMPLKQDLCLSFQFVFCSLSASRLSPERENWGSPHFRTPSILSSCILICKYIFRSCPLHTLDSSKLHPKSRWLPKKKKRNKKRLLCKIQVI